MRPFVIFDQNIGRNIMLIKFMYVRIEWMRFSILVCRQLRPLSYTIYYYVGFKKKIYKKCVNYNPLIREINKNCG